MIAPRVSARRLMLVRMLRSRSSKEAFRIRLEALLAARTAEIERLAVPFAPERRLVPVDRHAADGVARPAPDSQPHENDRDDQEEDVQRRRVVPGDAPARDRV